MIVLAASRNNHSCLPDTQYSGGITNELKGSEMLYQQKHGMVMLALASHRKAWFDFRSAKPYRYLPNTPTYFAHPYDFAQQAVIHSLILGIMISRARLARNAQITFKRYHQARLNNSRKLATAISETFNYETGTAAGVKCASRDLAGPTTTLAVVAKAGTRYQVLPGYTEGLEKFAFKVCFLTPPSC